jgi:predicted RNA-binding Zn ribbon-like protein
MRVLLGGSNRLSVYASYCITITGYNQTLVMSKQAPGDLEVIRLFINTLDVEEDKDELDSAWLESNGLATARVSEKDVERARDLREALRDLLDEHVPDPTGRLNAIGAGAPLTVAFDEHGHAHLHPAGTGFAAIAARVLAIVERAQADGTWDRMKACAADTCRWAFYDQSRNRSRQWCDMAVCGNRAKARSYRKRTS